MKLEKEYALIGVTMIDGNGGPPISDATVVVKDGVIDNVGNKQSVALEDNVQKVNLSGNYLMPGLIDAHVHFTGVKSCNHVDWVTEPNYLQAIRTVADANNVLDYGFTTVRSAGSRYDIYLKKAIEEGTIPGPRIMTSWLGICRSGGNQDAMPRDIYGIPDEWAHENYVWAQPCDGVEEIRKAVRRLLGRNVDHVKFYPTGGGLWKSDRAEDMHFSLEEMSTLVNEAHMVGLKVMWHACNLRAVEAAVELGADTIEHAENEEGDELDEETYRKMADKNIFLTPTLSINFVGSWAVKEMPKHLVDNYKKAIKNGVKILLGSDAHADPITPYGKYNIGEIKFLVDLLGMTPLQAITSATKLGAEACGIDDKVGTIEKGKLADLLVVKENPSVDIDVLVRKENVKYIIKEGNLAVEH